MLALDPDVANGGGRGHLQALELALPELMEEPEDHGGMPPVPREHEVASPRWWTELSTVLTMACT